MVYKFTGRIKKIGYDNGSYFCQFNVDNSIKINDEDVGVAYSNSKDLTIVETFFNIEKDIFEILLTSQNERFEIEYRVVLLPNVENFELNANEANRPINIGSNVVHEILKVTIKK